MAGLMDDLNRMVKDVTNGAKELLDKTDIDEKLVGAAKDLKDKAQAVLDSTDIDEKLVGAARDLKDKAQETFEKVRPGVEETLARASVGAKELIDKAGAKLNTPEARDAMDHIRDQVDAQVSKIRAAATGTDPIHDFFNAKPEAEPSTEPVAEAEPAAEPEPEAEPAAEPEPEAEPAAEPEPEAEPAAEPEAEAEPAAEPEAEAEPAAEPAAEPEPEAEPEYNEEETDAME